VAMTAKTALGQKRTFRDADAMSALPPKADIGTQLGNVRFVPKADILQRRGHAIIHFHCAPVCGSVLAPRPIERANSP